MTLFILALVKLPAIEDVSDWPKETVSIFPTIPERCEDVRTFETYFPAIRGEPNAHLQRVPQEYIKLRWTNLAVDDIGFLHSPKNICPDNLFLLWMVLSAVDASPMREAARETYAGVKRIHHKEIRLVFIVGRPRDPYLQTLLDKEVMQYGDIVQADFLDSLENMTIKSIVAMRWVLKYCAGTSFIARGTDDILVNTYKVLDQLASFHPYKVYFGCPRQDNLDIHREGRFKYKSEVVWSSKLWPPFQDGFFIVFSLDVMRDFYLLSCKSPLTWPEDTYLGTLATLLRLKLLGRSQDCVAVGHRPYWNVTEKALRQLSDPESNVLVVHFGGNPLLRFPNLARDIRTNWKLIEERKAYND